MQAPVAVWLRCLNIILFGDELDVVLAQKQLGEVVNIVDIAADDADAGNVVEVRRSRVEAELQPLGFQLGDHAVDGFQTALDVVDGIMVVADAKLVVEDFELGADLLDRGAVYLMDADKILKLLAQRLIFGQGRELLKQILCGLRLIGHG